MSEPHAHGGKNSRSVGKMSPQGAGGDSPTRPASRSAEPGRWQINHPGPMAKNGPHHGKTPRQPRRFPPELAEKQSRKPGRRMVPRCPALGRSDLRIAGVVRPFTQTGGGLGRHSSVSIEPTAALAAIAPPQAERRRRRRSPAPRTRPASALVGSGTAVN